MTIIDPRHEAPPHGDWPHWHDHDEGPFETTTNDDFLRVLLLICGFFAGFVLIFIAGITMWIASMVVAWPADLDGRYAASNPQLHAWFDKLASGKGLCCSITDGRTVDDPDVDMNAGHYRVRVDGQWLDVPDDALVTVPNIYGQAVVWPVKDSDGHVWIRCFLPGGGA